MSASAENTPPQANPEIARRRRQEAIRRRVEQYRTEQAQMDPQKKEAVRSEISREIKEEISNENANAGRVSSVQDMSEGRVPDQLVEQARNVHDAVSLFVAAAEADLIKKPAHEPSRIVFDALVRKLSDESVTLDSSSYFQPLIHGLLTSQNYISFSKEGQPPTPFEQDLIKIVAAYGKSKAEQHLEEIIASTGENIGLTLDRLNTKKDEARAFKQQRIQEYAERELQESRKRTRQNLDPELIAHIKEGQEDNPQAQEAERFINHLDSSEKFLEYYQDKFDIALARIEAEGRIINPDKRRERAAKMVTEDIHKLILFMTHRIYASVIDSSGREPWQKLVAESSRMMYMNADTFFNALSSKIGSLVNSVSEATELDDALPLFKYGNQSTTDWIEMERDVTDKTGKTVQIGGKLISYTAPSHELQRTNSYKDFLNDLFLSARAEKDLLEGGINFDYLMRTGQMEQQNATFFQQAAAYAQRTLEANRLDELYKLPYAEVVEAAKIHLSGYYKKKMARNRWLKSPEILQGLFSNVDEAEKEALKDMVINYHDADPPVPPWAIKRAIIHARMHLSLVNLEMHALSSYADAPVTELGKASYKDPALKNLDVFQTWFPGQQWQMSDMFLKSMAFMPQPDRSWKIDDWNHADIKAEGEDIYDQSFRIGKLARHGRRTYTKDMDPNIFERNPMGFGGLETQRGWRFKYSLMPWLRDYADNFNDPNELNVDGKPRGLEYAWKQIENIGLTPMQVLRDELILKDHLLKQSPDGTAKYQEQYRHLFTYLYNRFFKEGVGRAGLSTTFTDKNYNERIIRYADINSADEFWSRVVEPILNRPTIQGRGQDPVAAEKRNTQKRSDDLKVLINQALTVMAFERSPLDFVYIENPSKSQNGVTFISVLEKHFQKNYHALDGMSSDAKDKMLDDAFDDILYVQQRARIVSAQQMNEFVATQNDEESAHQKTVFGENLGRLNDERSNIMITAEQEKSGYLIDESVVRGVLKEKYKIDEAGITDEERQKRQKKIDAGLEVYRMIQERVIEKPEINDHEIVPEITPTRLKMAAKDRGMDWSEMNSDQQSKLRHELSIDLKNEFTRARDEDMVTRFMWSMNELIASKEAALPINDTAYQFLEFVRAGKDMVQRSVYAIAVTQEKYRQTLTGGDLLSALKKYYRNEDKSDLHKKIVEMRSSIKEEDADAATEMALRVLENAMNVLRINSDAENLIVDSKYQLEHRDRSGFSVVVKEGPQYPLRREDRYHLITDFLHYAQFPKRAAGADQEWEYEKAWTMADVMGNMGEFGAKIGAVADKFLGNEGGKMVRNKWKELSGEGLRSREYATIAHLLTREGPKYLVLIAAAIVILGMVRGFQETEEK